ncbi:MAG: nucleotidyltransferase domain-containing protein [Planctomycetota bacterium]|nr:nucleotidyltransferase domain-containing protein [Planctomycetota bacterium]
MKDIHALRERAKELRCLYAVDAIVSDRGRPPARTFLRVLEAIPAGWQHPDTTGAAIEYLGRRYVGPGFAAQARVMSEPIRLWGADVGRISVSDDGDLVRGAETPFLAEEAELLRRIAGRLADFLEWKHTELLGDRSAGGRDHWAWRQRFAEALADSLDPGRFGVSRAFVGGSTARGDAGPGSDIDLYFIADGTPEQRRELSLWIEGWSLCLAEVALHQTGQPFPGGILNLHWLEGEPRVAHRT